MSFLKNYLKPGSPDSKKNTAPKHDAPTAPNQPPVELPPMSPPMSAGGSRGGSLHGSRPTSVYPAGDWRNQALEEINAVKCDVMVNWLHQQQMERLWTSGALGEGVILKKNRKEFVCCPTDLAFDPEGIFTALESLNVKVAMTVNTRVIKLFLHNNELPYVPLNDGLRLQVLPDVSFLPRCAKHHFAAFIANSGILVVWDDDPRHLLARADNIEKQLMAMIWQGESLYPQEKDEKRPNVNVEELRGDGVDLETLDLEKPRRIVLLQPIMVAVTLCLTIIAIGAGWRQVAVEIVVDKYYLRLLFAFAVPAQVWLALFFFQTLCGNVFQIIGPISQMKENTRYYSGIAPRRLNRDNGALPHITIQMPVYKEGLAAVIEPTIRSIKAAISTYEMQGGTANIFVNDDGMRLISEEDAGARQDFYDENNIGWVARPKHNPKPQEGEEVFLRRGKFKKASNMNYALWVSNRVEEKLQNIPRDDKWTAREEASAYDRALREVVEDDQGRTWADGNIRMGDYILLIDSDTRVPTDCFLDAVSEMERSPSVAIIQFSSGVMNVTDNFFERGITFFTNLIYTAIQFAVANGDVAPFVGHNAVLRWSAVQAIAYDCRDDHREKYWSEATVSEDFDMALRLQTAGYHIRLGAYTGEGFKEGVSLTVYDELARWEKYAYGCSELIFNPVKYWITRGPFTPLFRKFLGSRIPFPSKFTIMAYVGTYFALASAWLFTLVNYFAVGWFNGSLDHYYLDSFKIYFSIIIVFTVLGNGALAVFRYRIETHTIFGAFWENFKWIPLLTVFLGGVSIHVSQAILCHLFSIDMSWGATAKEVENTTFFQEIPKVLKKFKFTFLFCIGCAIMMAVLAHAAPVLWRIRLLIAIWPLGSIIFGHFLLPIALNPNLMLFTW